MKLISTGFAEGGSIPVKYSCDGENLSPPLEWSGVPEQAKSLALVLDDPDAPSGIFVHWVLANLPAAERSLPEGAGAPDTRLGAAVQGKNALGKTGYAGPCPPAGTHHYYFHLYALDTVLEARPDWGRSDLDSAMKGHIVAQATLMGRYQREPQAAHG